MRDGVLSFSISSIINPDVNDEDAKLNKHTGDDGYICRARLSCHGTGDRLPPLLPAQWRQMLMDQLGACSAG